jgi:hypothetical protein
MLRRKAMLHHYLEYVDEDTIAEAEIWSADLSELYGDLEKGSTHSNGSNDYSSSSRGRGGAHGASMHEGGRLKCPTLFPSF